MTRTAVGIDIGGTYTKVAVVTVEGETVHQAIWPTPQTPEKLSTDVLEQIDFAVRASGDPDGVGIGLPGMLDQTGRLLFLPHLPGLSGCDPVRWLGARLPWPVYADNDGHCALRAHLYLQPELASEVVAMLTLGTGTGSAVAFCGALNRGTSYSPPGLGEAIIDPSGPRCSCGRNGCLNAYTGRHGIERLATERIGRTVSAMELQRLADTGDTRALGVYAFVGEHLGIALANAISVWGVTRVILAGQGTAAWVHMADATTTIMNASTFGAADIAPVVEVSDLGTHGGAIGAACMVWQSAAVGRSACGRDGSSDRRQETRANLDSAS